MQLSPDQNLNKSAGKENASFIQIDFNPLYTGNPQTCTLANSEDPDEKFHQGLHCLLGLKKASWREVHHILENSTCKNVEYVAWSIVL